MAAPYDGVILGAGHGGWAGFDSDGNQPHTMELGGEVLRGYYTTPARNGKRFTFTDLRPPQFVAEGVLNRWIMAGVIAAYIDEGVYPHDCITMRQWKRAPHWTELEQRDVSLTERVAYCRLHRELPYVSIHCNAQGMTNTGPSRPKRGTQIFTHPGETGADGIARAMLPALDAALQGWGSASRGDWKTSIHEANFHVLRKTPQEAVLVECGYFDNADDAAFLASVNAPRLFGRGIVAATMPLLNPPHRRNRYRFRRSSSRAQS